MERTQSIFVDYSISQDSLIHQYKYATKGFAVKLNEKQAEILRKDSRIKYVVNDFSYKATQELTPTYTTMTTQKSASTVPWGVARVYGPLDGTGKRAWVLDTGIQLDHPELNVDTGNSASFVADETATDIRGHGTSVAGVIAAKDNSSDVVGVAANAFVVAVKVCEQSGRCYVSDLKGGVDYVAGSFSSGDVANISLSYPVNDDTNPNIDISLSILEDAIITAADAGLMFTLAAGNQGIHAENRSPGRVVNNNVWTISSMDENDEFHIHFSNYGNPPINYANPGVDIFTTAIDNGTTTVSGTSFAAPHVAGILLATGDEPVIGGYVSNDPSDDPDPIAVVPALKVSISGQTYIDSGEEGTWTAHPEYGTGSYSYQWAYRSSTSDPWTLAGTDSDTFSWTFHNNSTVIENNYIKVDVSSGSENASSELTVTVAPSECEPNEIMC